MIEESVTNVKRNQNERLVLFLGAALFLALLFSVMVLAAVQLKSNADKEAATVKVENNSNQQVGAQNETTTSPNKNSNQWQQDLKTLKEQIDDLDDTTNSELQEPDVTLE